MSTLQHDAIYGERPNAVVSWRTCRLREVGFAADLAESLAWDCAYDLHALLSPRLPTAAGGADPRAARRLRPAVLMPSTLRSG
jgi:hypothetical protein